MHHSKMKPAYCWNDNYYQPMQARFDQFLEKHQHSDMAKNLIETEKNEITRYKKYKDYLSYGFYIAKKINKKSSI